jgi:type II secretion system protein H
MRSGTLRRNQTVATETRAQAIRTIPPTGRAVAAHRAAGFSLIEVMVVLIVIGVVLAAAVPSVTERNARNRSEGAARQLSARMQIARQMAVSQRVPYRMTIDPAGGEYWFERQDDDSTWTMDPDRVFVIEGVDDVRTNIGGQEGETEVRFQTRGTLEADDSPALITIISTNADTANLSMVRTGRATVRMAYHQ